MVKSLPKLIRRFVVVLLLSSVLLFLFNFALFALYVGSQKPNGHPWTTASQVADALSEEGCRLPKELALELERDHVWAIWIEEQTKKVVWHTKNLPAAVPLSYSLSDIAGLTRGYIDGYPTFTGEAENGLAVLGYPKDSFWKHMWPSWDYSLISNLPGILLCACASNLALLFLIYLFVNTKLLKSVKPIVGAIQSLPAKETVRIPETGLFAELAASINKASEILQTQNRQLRKKETARANWIAGVSHDIRTPLSMVMGYADQLEQDPRLGQDSRKKAAVIVTQSRRMRNLINDLNLASKLEYNMQPVNLIRQNLVALLRQVAVDFINMDIDAKYPVIWETKEALTVCPAEIDKGLVKRAVSNLIQNCMYHNAQGCSIFVRVETEESHAVIVVEDNGSGADDEQIEQLNRAPHYMVCDENTTKQRHGLGLLIVKQIMAAHGGTVKIGHSSYGGFCVKLSLPIVN